MDDLGVPWFWETPSWWFFPIHLKNIYKYARQIGFHFPKDRGENSTKCFSCHHLDACCCHDSGSMMLHQYSTPVMSWVFSHRRRHSKWDDLGKCLQGSQIQWISPDFSTKSSISIEFLWAKLEKLETPSFLYISLIKLLNSKMKENSTAVHEHASIFTGLATRSTTSRFTKITVVEWLTIIVNGCFWFP